MLGHDAPPQGLWLTNLITDEPLSRCPLQELLEPRAARTAGELLRHADTYYPAYLDGHLLEAGGWSDQPARYADYMLTLRDYEARAERKYLDITKEDAT